MGDVTKRPQAKQDLIEQATYLYLAEPLTDVSERFLTSAEAAFGRLADLPGLGARVDLTAPRLADLRRWPVPGFRNHLIFYRQTDTGIDVVRVLHGARDLAALLENEGEDEAF